MLVQISSRQHQHPDRESARPSQSLSSSFPVSRTFLFSSTRTSCNPLWWQLRRASINSREHGTRPLAPNATQNLGQSHCRTRQPTCQCWGTLEGLPHLLGSPTSDQLQAESSTRPDYLYRSIFRGDRTSSVITRLRPWQVVVTAKTQRRPPTSRVLHPNRKRNGAPSRNLGQPGGPSNPILIPPTQSRSDRSYLV